MKEIKLLSFEDLLEEAENAPPQTDEQKQATYEILLKLDYDEETARLVAFGHKGQ